MILYRCDRCDRMTSTVVNVDLEPVDGHPRTQSERRHWELCVDCAVVFRRDFIGEIRP